MKDFPKRAFRQGAERLSAAPAEKSGAGGSSVPTKENKEPKEKETKSPIEQAEAVRLVYHIQEGPQTRVRRILIGGYRHTRPGVIHREVHIKVKEPLREGDVVESQRRLYTSEFSIASRSNRRIPTEQIQKRTSPSSWRKPSATRWPMAVDSKYKDWRARPARRGRKSRLHARDSRGKQVESDRAGDSLSFKLRGSTLQGRALLGIRRPNAFANPHFSFQATAFAEKTRDINTFTEDRYEGSVQLNRTSHAADDRALPLCFPPGARLQSENSERRSAALQPAHAGFTVRSDVVPRFARQSRRRIKGEFQQRGLQRRRHQSWFERQLPAVFLAKLHLLSDQTPIQFCAFHAIGLPGAL